MKCLLDWNLNRKISTVTLDNCSTNDAIVERLKGLLSTESLILGANFFHMQCAAHILNLIVKDGLSVIESGITCVTNSVSYWSSSPKWVKNFELACHQMQMDMKKLRLDCPTRWNSTFEILELVVKYKSIFFLDCNTSVCLVVRNGSWPTKCWII